MRLITILLLMISVNAFGQTKGALENPSQGSFTSGIYMFSGWACDAELIEIVINGGSGLKAAYGTARGDTKGICGDSDNGFGLLYNMANLGTGEHTAVAFADGLEIGRSTFNVQRLSTGEFLRGAESAGIVTNFPSTGRESVLTWVESAQNYAIAFEQAAVDPYTISGMWFDETTGMTYNISSSRLFLERQELYVLSGSAGNTYTTKISVAYDGILVGDTARLFQVEPDYTYEEVTLFIQDPLTMIWRLDSCVSYDITVNCGVAGSSRILKKVRGPNTGRSVPLDGGKMTPVGSAHEEYVGE